MADIKFIVTTEKFKKDVKKIKDRGLKEGLKKQILDTLPPKDGRF